MSGLSSNGSVATIFAPPRRENAPPSPTASSASTKPRAARGHFIPASAIIGEDSTSRSSGQRPARAIASAIAAPIEWARPNQGFGQEASSTSLTKAAKSRS